MPGLFRGRRASAAPDFPIILRPHRRARRLRLRIDPDRGQVILVIPPGTTHRDALAWAKAHENWARNALSALPQRQEITDGSYLPLFGQSHRVDWQPEAGRRVRIEGDRIMVGGAKDQLESRLMRFLKAEALRLLDDETRAIAAAHGLAVQKVGIGDPRSRWGSCSANGSIRYSWRLIFAPPEVRRAVVAHEVAHLKHLDHGPLFHALVDLMVGAEAAKARLWLRREGAALHRIGRPKFV